MKVLFIMLSLFVSVLCNAEERIIETDSIGNKQYHKQQYVTQGDKIYQTDSVGNTQYHKPSYKVEGSRIYQTDTVGNIQYHKPSYSIDSKGKSK